MNFHAFYNPTYVGDTLLIRLGEGTTASYSCKEDVTVLKDMKNEIIGYNIHHASQYFKNISSGWVKITQEIVDACNTLLSAHQLPLVSFDGKEKFIVGQIVAIEKHPDANHLHICQVDLKTEVVQIVCGAKNVAKGQTVVVATIGAVMPSGMIIKPSTLRKVDSMGMLCSARELLLTSGFNTEGIIVLDTDTYRIGESFF